MPMAGISHCTLRLKHQEKRCASPPARVSAYRVAASFKLASTTSSTEAGHAKGRRLFAGVWSLHPQLPGIPLSQRGSEWAFRPCLQRGVQRGKAPLRFFSSPKNGGPRGLTLSHEPMQPATCIARLEASYQSRGSASVILPTISSASFSASSPYS
jgi:hypothetical protein